MWTAARYLFATDVQLKIVHIKVLESEWVRSQGAGKLLCSQASQIDNVSG